MTPKESSVRYTNRNVQAILHKENVAWFSLYAILVVREKEIEGKKKPADPRGLLPTEPFLFDSHLLGSQTVPSGLNQ